MIVSTRTREQVQVPDFVCFGTLTGETNPQKWRCPNLTACPRSRDLEEVGGVGSAHVRKNATPAVRVTMEVKKEPDTPGNEQTRGTREKKISAIG